MGEGGKGESKLSMLGFADGSVIKREEVKRNVLSFFTRISSHGVHDEKGDKCFLTKLFRLVSLDTREGLKLNVPLVFM